MLSAENFLCINKDQEAYISTRMYLPWHFHDDDDDGLVFSILHVFKLYQEDGMVISKGFV